jgi:hypothetical protein
MSATLPPDLRASILDDARKTPSPDRTQTRRANTIALVLGVATAVTMIAALGLTLGGRPITFVALTLAGWAAIALATSAIGESRGKTMLGRARIVLVVFALASAPAIFAWVMGCTIGWPEVRDGAGSLRQHIACLLATLLLSTGPLVALAFVRRASDPVHPRATGAAIGAAAGAWGGVLIDMHCPLTEPMHVALAHVAPVIIYATIGALVGSRLFGVRARSDR